jgi:hypothetical protein
LIRSYDEKGAWAHSTFVIEKKIWLSYLMLKFLVLAINKKAIAILRNGRTESYFDAALAAIYCLMLNPFFFPMVLKDIYFNTH